MKIDQSSWHCRLYLWWYEHKYHYPSKKGFSNLCPYMRAVMFWAPLRAFFGNWVKIGGVPFNLFSIPFLLYLIPALGGYVSYNFKVFLWVVYGVAVGAAIVIALGVSVGWLLSQDGLGWGELLVDRLGPSAKATKGFFALVRAYLRSAHDRVCPEISWGNHESNS